MTGRSIWRGTVTRRRIVTRVVECEHCHRYYDVVRDFDRHYEGACVRHDAVSAEEPVA